MQATLSTLLIVWRESIEALLVIGILYAWLKKHGLQPQIYRLWFGAALGLVLAGGLAVVFFFAGQWFSGPGGEWFFAGMMALAALLIMQMIVWIHGHGRSLKSDLEHEAARTVSRSGGLGLTLIAMIAVAREGSETVIFLAGVGSQYQGTGLGLFAAGGAAGFILALLSFFILNYLANAVSWRCYFRLSEAVLLLIGGAMMVSACDKIADQLAAFELPGWLFAFMGDPLWNMQGLLPDNSWFASMLASLTGYRAQPSLMEVLALALYWAAALGFSRRAGKNARIRQAVIAQSRHGAGSSGTVELQAHL